MIMPSPRDDFYHARIVERKNISDSLLVMQVDPGGEFPFVPGQYATLGVIAPKNIMNAPIPLFPHHTRSS